MTLLLLAVSLLASPSLPAPCEGKPVFTCTIDTADQSSNCKGASAVPQLRYLKNGRTLATLSMKGYRSVAVHTVACDSKRFYFHLASSPTNDGFCGDAAMRTHDAELWARRAPETGEDSLTACENDVAAATPGGARQFTFDIAPAGGCSPLSVTVSDGSLTVRGKTVSSPHLFRFGLPDKEGHAPSWELYLGLNTSVGRPGEREGSGVTQARLCFYE